MGWEARVSIPVVVADPNAGTRERTQGLGRNLIEARGLEDIEQVLSETSGDGGNPANTSIQSITCPGEVRFIRNYI